jgi:hypothetical protein
MTVDIAKKEAWLFRISAAVLLVGLVSMAIGYLFIRRIVDIKV